LGIKQTCCKKLTTCICPLCDDSTPRTLLNTKSLIKGHLTKYHKEWLKKEINGWKLGMIVKSEQFLCALTEYLEKKAVQNAGDQQSVTDYQQKLYNHVSAIQKHHERMLFDRDQLNNALSTWLQEDKDSPAVRNLVAGFDKIVELHSEFKDALLSDESVASVLQAIESIITIEDSSDEFLNSEDAEHVLEAISRSDATQTTNDNNQPIDLDHNDHQHHHCDNCEHCTQEPPTKKTKVGTKPKTLQELMKTFKKTGKKPNMTLKKRLSEFVKQLI
jgi:hypothetical protein